MSKDDREAFQANLRAQSVALGQDRAVFEKSTELLVELDRYDYSYLWNWMGVPIIQMPADVMATQEVIWSSRPDLIIETGVARGGSVLMLASMLQLIGGGRVIGVDIDIRSHNRESIEAHPMGKHVDLVEGDSTSSETVEKIRSLIPEGARVMVVLDSDHSRDHVFNELKTFAPFVSTGCYLVVADTLLGYLSEGQTPQKRSSVWLKGNEPLQALNDFLDISEGFERDPVINGKLVMSSSPNGYLKRSEG